MKAFAYSPQQTTAITAPINAAILVRSGPGSGKTRIVAGRYVHLIEQGIAQQSIIVTTFSTRAADEIRRRILTLNPNVGGTQSICTIHALCRRMLAAYGDDRVKTPTWILRSRIEQTIESLKLTNVAPNWRTIQWWIDYAVRQSTFNHEQPELTFSRLMADESPQWEWFGPVLAKCYNDIQAVLKERNSFTFPGLLSDVYYHLTTSNAFLKWARRTYKYAIIDEAQDTETIAIEILRLIVGDSLFVVGDENQTLYSFNGASMPALNYAHTFDVSTNYRSVSSIVDAANKFAKTMRADAIDQIASRTSKSAAVQYLGLFPNQDQEASVVAKTIDDKKLPYEDVFVIARTNAQLAFIEVALAMRQIPYTLTDDSFFARSHVKKVISYLYVATGTATDEMFYDIWNVPSTKFRGYGGSYSHTRFLGADLQTWISENYSHDAFSTISSHPSKSDGISDLITFVNQIRSKLRRLSSSSDSLSSVVKFISDAVLMSYKTSSLTLDPGISDDVGGDDLTTLQAISRKYDVDTFLKFVSSLKSGSVKGKVVVLSTIHKAKGLERPVVFGIGLSEGLLPHYRAIEEHERNGDLGIRYVSSLIDERRAMYVLMTRAMDMLFLSASCTSSSKHLIVSRFITELGL